MISKRHERVTIRRRSKQVIHREYCNNCQKQVGWIELEEAGILAELSQETVEQELNNGNLDHRVRSNGQILVCINSLLK